MESKDLMIGDWVRAISAPWRDEITKVQHNDFVDGCLKFQPIPLTPEILEKNGFDVGTFCSVFKDEEGRIEIYIRRFELDITKGWYTEDEETFSLPPVYYVHQYQHSLRLCGLTELADNFQLPELPNEDTK